MARIGALPARIGALGARLAIETGSRDRRRQAAAPWRQWYATARWRALRQQVLRRAGWCCEQTGVVLTEGRDAPNAAVIDHIRPHRGDPVLFWDPENLQAVAKAWHDRDKQRAERGPGEAGGGMPKSRAGGR